MSLEHGYRFQHIYYHQWMGQGGQANTLSCIGERLNLEYVWPVWVTGLIRESSGPKILIFLFFFKALRAGLTNPRDISDSFTVTPL